MNKKLLYPLLVWSVFSYTNAWTQIKHHQSKFYSWENGQWKLVETTYQSWYPNGLSKATKTYDDLNQTFSFYDSTGYNSFGETVYYQEWKRNSSNTAWLNRKKFDYQYDGNNKLVAGSGYAWDNNRWIKFEGFQRNTQWDIAGRLETIIQLTYDQSSDSYVNAMKFENEYNNLGQIISSTVLTANPPLRNFENYYRDIYKGWHSVEDDIPIQHEVHIFTDNQWKTMSTSTTVLKAGLWETITENENGEKFKTIFDTKRENVTQSKIVNGGLLLWYEKLKNGSITTQQWNQYNNQNQLFQVHMEEVEKDSRGQIIRTTDKFAYNGGSLAKENEVLTTYTYNASGAITSIITSEYDLGTGQTQFTGKIEYLDFRNVGIPLAIHPSLPDVPYEPITTGQAYPNPFSESITIPTSGLWVIRSIDGKVWHEGQDANTINTMHWPSGLYFVEALESEDKKPIKIVKK